MSVKLDQTSNDNQPVDDSSTSPTDSSAETVSKEAYEQVKADMIKFKNQFRESSDAVENLNKKIEDMETESLKSKSNYKDLYEKAQQKLVDAQGETKSIKNAYLEDKKLSAIEKEALSQGVNKKALDLIRSSTFDKSNVMIETTSTGRVNVIGASEFVEDLKKNWGDLFFSSKPSKINSTNPDVSNLQDPTLTSKDLLKLQKENPAAYKEKMNLIQQGKLSLQGA